MLLVRLEKCFREDNESGWKVNEETSYANSDLTYMLVPDDIPVIAALQEGRPQ